VLTIGTNENRVKENAAFEESRSGIKKPAAKKKKEPGKKSFKEMTGPEYMNYLNRASGGVF